LGTVEKVEDGAGGTDEEEEEEEDQEEPAAEGGGTSATTAAAVVLRLGAVGGAVGAGKLGFRSGECRLGAGVGGGFGRRVNPISHGGFCF